MIYCYSRKERIFLDCYSRTIDIDKVFDSVSWLFIQKALGFFNLGPDIKRWLITLYYYKNASTCVSVNGQYSSWFNIYREVRQGDSCSPSLYLIIICRYIVIYASQHQQQHQQQQLQQQKSDVSRLCMNYTCTKSIMH